MYVQVVRLDRLLKYRYAKDYEPFQNSFLGDSIFNPAMRFVRSGRYIGFNDPELESLCRSVQKRFNIFLGLILITALVFLLI